MSKRSTVSFEDRLAAVRLYLEQGISVPLVAKHYLVSETTIYDWVRKYQSQGIGGLKESQTWKRYDQTTKEQAVA